MKKKVTVWILCVAVLIAFLPVQALAGSDTPAPLYNLPDGATGKVVINLGNGNGKYNFADYTGSKTAGTALRYTTEPLEDYADDEGNVLINLPSDDDLGADFIVVDAVGSSADADYKPDVTITPEREKAYDYKLVGWINIASGAYVDVSSGSSSTVINLGYENVFYADWIAADYNLGSSSDSNLRDDVVSTANFVTMHMFDYNELFNLYSESLEQNIDENGNISESWTDGQTLYSALPYGKGGV